MPSSAQELLTHICRACGGRTSQAFTTRILGRYDVAFLCCTSCHSLQSEPPYWLAEAYQAAVAASDTGAVVRNLNCHAAILAVARTLRLGGRFLDYGGGAGMLCRMLRDSGFDAYLYDRYAEPVYARTFTLDPAELTGFGLGLVSAIEVLEHYENPAVDVAGLFALRPQVLFATTIPYRGEGEDWWYLAKQTGQHVFFYSPQCLQLLAQAHGYEYFGVGSFHIFSRVSISAGRRAVLRVLLSSLGLRLVRTWIAATMRGEYADADSEALGRRSSHARGEAVDSVSGQ